MELDIEFNKLGSVSLFASPGRDSFLHSRGPQHCVLKELTPLPFPFPDCGWWGDVGVRAKGRRARQVHVQ